MGNREDKRSSINLSRGEFSTFIGKIRQSMFFPSICGLNVTCRITSYLCFLEVTLEQLQDPEKLFHF